MDLVKINGELAQAKDVAGVSSILKVHGIEPSDPKDLQNLALGVPVVLDTENGQKFADPTLLFSSSPGYKIVINPDSSGLAPLERRDYSSVAARVAACSYKR